MTTAPLQRFRPRTLTWLAALALLLGACRDLTGVERERSPLGIVLAPTYDTLYVATPENGTIK